MITKRQKIAVIGSGISSLTSAYMLSREHDVHLFEKNNYIGGHTHTHKINQDDKAIIYGIEFAPSPIEK